MSNSNTDIIELISSLITNDTVTNDTISNDIVPNDTIPNDMVPNDTVSNDMVPNDTMSNDMVPTDMIPTDMVPNDTVSNDTVPIKMSEYRDACRLINVQINDFYDNIYLPIKHFKFDKWKVNKTLYSNEDSLFYNMKYLIDDTKFQEIFSKYVLMIGDIMDPRNILMQFLHKWTNKTNKKWVSESKETYLKKIINNNERISPIHITNIYKHFCKLHRSDIDKAKSEIEACISEININIDIVTNEFINKYDDIINSYVYLYPLDVTVDRDAYVADFMNNILMTIYAFAETLIDLNVYAIHKIVYDIVDFYLPLDDIYIFKPSEHNGKKLIIV